MKALVINRFGASDVFERAEVDKPEPAPGEVVIEVRATSVNPVDWKMRNGFAAFLVPQFPAILHPDCAGVVSAVARDVTDFAPGDRVYAFASGLMGKPGALAEFMAADARMVAKMPARLSFEEAASLPLVWVTAAFALLDRLTIPAGARLLIQGGTGGVGIAAVQLAAAHLSAEVTATCGSAEKCALAKELGARHAFDYRTEAKDIVAEATVGDGFDVVFNTVGAPAIDAAVKATRFGGTIVDINGAFPTEGGFQFNQLGFLSVFAGHPMTHGTNVEKVGAFLRDLTARVEAGDVRPVLDDKRFSFATIGAAHDHQETGHPTGKAAVSATW